MIVTYCLGWDGVQRSKSDGMRLVSRCRARTMEIQPHKNPLNARALSAYLRSSEHKPLVHGEFGAHGPNSEVQAHTPLPA